LHFPPSEWSLPEAIPGAAGQSIHSWIVQRPPTEAEAFPKLPDDQRRWPSGQVAYAAGTWDAVIAREGGTDAPSEVGDLIIDALTGVQPSVPKLAELYQRLVAENALDYIDTMLTRLRRTRRLPAGRLRLLALWLVRVAPDRNPVKVGIALLNLAGTADDVDLLMTVGRHDEFTLYSVVALRNLLPPGKARHAVWVLAQATRGWGRVQAVRRLGTDLEPEITAWLLREGFRNAVMNAELAHLVATAADLAGSLDQPEIDRALFRGAGDLLVALIESPFKGITDYRDAPSATERYLRHAQQMADNLDDHFAVWQIHKLLTRGREQWTESAKAQWPSSLRQRLIGTATGILAREEWRPMAIAQLLSSDPQLFRRADRAAQLLGISTFEAHMTRLEQGDELNAWHWSRVLEQASGDQVGEVLQLAEERIRPELIATGPGLEFGLGPGFERHRAVDAILGAVKKRPGLGLPFVLAALNSPVTRNRSLAAQALDGWGRDSWGPGIEEALRVVVLVEPYEKNRDRMRRMLDGA
jgi:hypothetical protein